MYITPPRSGVQRGGTVLFSGSTVDGAFLLRLSLRFYCGVLRLVHACLFSFFRKKETACDMLRFYSARVGIAIVRSRMPCGYRDIQVHFGFVRFFWAIPTEYEGTRGTKTAAWRKYAFA